MSQQMQTSGHSAVMNNRVEAAESLDDFPTPPWATRALIEHVLWSSARENLKSATCWEPACGRRIMSDVLEEYFAAVHASDIESYATIYNRAPDFLADYRTSNALGAYHWMITNPPFNMALDFVLKALDEARQGVAILVRSNWIESLGRYEKLFRDRPPAIIAPFVERVPMIKGVWNPNASSATSYSWFVWDTEIRSTKPPKVVWIPPGCRKELTRDTDETRFSYRGRLDWLRAQHEYAIAENDMESADRVEVLIALQEAIDATYVRSLING
jgi:hypothetical protein